MILRVLAILTAVGAIIMNILAVVLPLNNRTTVAISDSFNAALVPAGYVFSIWGLIYLGLIAFPVYQFLKKNENFDDVNIFFIISNIANGVWIVLWHYGHYTWCLAVMLVLLISLIMCYTKLKVGVEKVDRMREIMVNAVFSLYLGWITVATVANFEDTLIARGFDGFGIDKNIWAFILIVVITIISGLFIYFRKDAVYTGVILWALFGVFIKSFDVRIVSYTAFLACLLILGYLIYSKYPDRFGINTK